MFFLLLDPLLSIVDVVNRDDASGGCEAVEVLGMGTYCKIDTPISLGSYLHNVRRAISGSRQNPLSAQSTNSRAPSISKADTFEMSTSIPPDCGFVSQPA